MQTPRCKRHVANVTLQTSCCKRHVASVTLQASRCKLRVANVTLPASRCKRHVTNVTLQTSCFKCNFASVTFQNRTSLLHILYTDSQYATRRQLSRRVVVMHCSVYLRSATVYPHFFCQSRWYTDFFCGIRRILAYTLDYTTVVYPRSNG